MDRPRKCLAAEPVVASADDLSTALTEMAWLLSEQRRINDELLAQIQPLQQAAEEQMRVKCGRQHVTFCDRLNALTEAAKSYAAEHRNELLEGESKSIEFTAATLKFVEQRETVAETEDVAKNSKGEACSLFESVSELALEAAKTWFKSLTQRGVELANVFDVSVKLNKTKVLKALTDQRVSEKQLAKLGLKRMRPDEEITIKLKDFDAVSHSEQAAA